VELINAWEVVPSRYWDDFEIISNAVMLMIAVLSFFVLGLPAQCDSGGPLAGVLANLAVPAITFPMNIDVFGYRIRPDHVLDDLWGWHLGWIICAAVQVLFLSGLVKKLLSRIKMFLNWLERVIKLLGSSLFDAIEKSCRSIQLTVSVGLIIWIVFFGIQIYTRGVAYVFSDTEIFLRSVWLWIATIIICLFIHIAPLAFKKARDAVTEMTNKGALAATLAVLLVLLTGVLPSMLQTIAMIVLIPLIPMGLLALAIKGIMKLKRTLKADPRGNGQEAEAPETEDKVNFKDLTVVLVCFIGLPLLILCLITALGQEGKTIITTQDLSDVSTWLNFITATFDVAKSLLDLLV